MQPRSQVEIPQQTVLVARAAFPDGSVAMPARDHLGEVFTDEQFVAAFGVRGAPAASPGALALVTALQYTENLTDRQAAQMVARAIDWKYALGLELTDPGFDASVLSKFRTRLVEHGLEEQIFTTMLDVLTSQGLIAAGGKQRSDSTHVISAVRDLNRLELAGESVRACLEALSVAAPDWLATAIDVGEWAHRYGPRIDSWRLPASQAKRDRLAHVYGDDALVLLRAVSAPAAPVWLAELPAVQTLRIVLVQNYLITTDSRGREVIRRREADTDGLPPARVRISSPYDTDTRWAAKGDDLFWNGFKVHLTETCDHDSEPDATCDHDSEPESRPAPNLIVNVATTAATVPDVKATTAIHQQLHDRRLLPDEHYLDAGYPSAETIATATSRYQVTMVTPALLDRSAQARAGTGYDKTAFTIDFDTRQGTCPQGQTNTCWSPATQRGTEVIVVKFAGSTCHPCPARAQCTTAKRRRRTDVMSDLRHDGAFVEGHHAGSGPGHHIRRSPADGGVAQAAVGVPVAGLPAAHVRGDAPRDRPQRANHEPVATGVYRRVAAPGSVLVISHASPVAREERLEAVRRVYQRSSAPLCFRTATEIRSLFAGWSMVNPGPVSGADRSGLGPGAAWRPDGALGAAAPGRGHGGLAPPGCWGWPMTRCPGSGPGFGVRVSLVRLLSGAAVEVVFQSVGGTGRRLPVGACRSTSE